MTPIADTEPPGDESTPGSSEAAPELEAKGRPRKRTGNRIKVATTLPGRPPEWVRIARGEPADDDQTPGAAAADDADTVPQD